MSDDSDDDLSRRLVDKLWQNHDERKVAAQQRPAGGTPVEPSSLDAARHSKYARQALVSELATIERAAVGERNDALNAAAFSLGQLVAAGALDEDETRDALHGAAMRAGLTEIETPKTINSGISKGKLEPRDLSDVHVSSSYDGVVSTEDAPFGAVSMSLSNGQPPVEPPSVDELDDFWNARPIHKHVHQFAQARRVSPWAVLGVVLCRVATICPPYVVLPPLVGGFGSLNLFVGLVGASGSGKGAAERVAADCLRVGQVITTMTTGSGEAIAHGYVRRVKGELEPYETAVMFTVPEIDTLGALTARQGATLLPELRRAWSGEALGFQYVDPAKRLPVAAHSYRLTLVMGIQPARASVLLDDADGGTPQRNIWCSAIDADAPDVAPDEPEPWLWKEPAYTALTTLHDASGYHVLRVCETARDAVDEVRLARVRGVGDPLDGHALLARLKTAAALSLLDSRCEVSDEDWRLAGIVMKQSDATRASVVETLRGVARQANVSKADSEAHRAAIIETKTQEASIKRAARAALRYLKRREGEWVASSEVKRKGIASRDRANAEVGIEALLTSGQVEEQPLPNGSRLRFVVKP